MKRQVIIYAPYGSCTDEQRDKIKAKFPDAEFTGKWVDGAVMWQDALEGRLSSI
jgi:hypothetical protein